MAANTGKPWTNVEDATLRRLWCKASDASIAKELRRTEKELIDRAADLKLPAGRRRNVGFPWTAESDARLRLLWGETSEQAIRASLGRTASRIIVRARSLGLPSQSQGMVSIKRVADRIGIHSQSLLKYLGECGVATSRLSPVTECAASKYRQAAVDPLVAETIVRQRDTRACVQHRYSLKIGRNELFVRSRMRSACMEERDREPRKARPVPVGVMQEIVDGVDGPWCAVWRAVIAEDDMPFARWFIALAVYDTLHVEKADREWIEIVATQKAQKTIDRIVERLGAKKPGVVRAVDVKAEKKGKAA